MREDWTPRSLVAAVAFALIVGMPAGGPATAAEHGDGAEALKKADLAFGQAAAEKGLDGWMSYFAEDAARVDLHAQVLRGLDAIRQHDAAVFADPAMKLTWEPIDAGLFDGGKLGYTRGSYELVRTDENGARAVLSAGHYLTLWRLDNGKWKVILDTGDPSDSPQP